MTIRVRIVFPLWVGMQFRNSTWPGQKSRGLWDGNTRVVVAVIFRANEVVLLDVISWCVTACLESPGCFTENADNLCLLTGSDLVSTLRCVCVSAHACACARYACVTDDKTAHPKNVIHTCHIKQLCFCNYTLIPKLIYFSQKHISSSCAYFYMWGPSVGDWEPWGLCALRPWEHAEVLWGPAPTERAVLHFCEPRGIHEEKGCWKW